MVTICANFCTEEINLSILIVNILMLVVMFWQLTKANKQIALQTNQIKHGTEYANLKKNLKLLMQKYLNSINAPEFDTLGKIGKPNFNGFGNEEEILNVINGLYSYKISTKAENSLYASIRKTFNRRKTIKTAEDLNQYRDSINGILKQL